MTEDELLKHVQPVSTNDEELNKAIESNPTYKRPIDNYSNQQAPVDQQYTNNNDYQSFLTRMSDNPNGIVYSDTPLTRKVYANIINEANNTNSDYQNFLTQLSDNKQGITYTDSPQMRDYYKQSTGTDPEDLSNGQLASGSRPFDAQTTQAAHDTGLDILNKVNHPADYYSTPDQASQQQVSMPGQVTPQTTPQAPQQSSIPAINYSNWFTSKAPIGQQPSQPVQDPHAFNTNTSSAPSASIPDYQDKSNVGVIPNNPKSWFAPKENPTPEGMTSPNNDVYQADVNKFQTADKFDTSSFHDRNMKDFMDKVTMFNIGARKATSGIPQMYLKHVQKPIGDILSSIGSVFPSTGLGTIGQGLNTEADKMLQGMSETDAVMNTAQKQIPDTIGNTIAKGFGSTVGYAGSGAVGATVGGIAAPGLASGAIASSQTPIGRIAAMTLGGMAQGAAQYTNDESNRPKNALIGGLIGAAGQGFTEGIKGLTTGTWKEGIKRILGTQSQVIDDLAKDYKSQGITGEQILKGAQVGGKEGVNLSPGEAIHDELVRPAEAAIRGSKTARQGLAASQTLKSNNIVKGMNEIVDSMGASGSKYKELISGYGDDLNASQIGNILFSKTKAPGIFDNKKVSTFLQDVVNSGGNKQQAKSLVDVLQKVNNSPINKVIGKEEPSILSNSLAYTPGGITANLIRKSLHGRYNDALIKVIQDPQWSAKVAEAISKGSLDQKSSALGKVLKDAWRTYYNSDVGKAIDAAGVRSMAQTLSSKLNGE